MNEPFDLVSYLEKKLKQNPFDYACFFDEIKNQFDLEKTIFCYEYILKNSNDTKLINRTIKEINSNKTPNCLGFLIDFILKPSTKSDFLDLKVLAIKTISNYRDKNALGALMYCLNDKNSNYKIRLSAIEALGKIGDKSAFEPLGKIICDDKEKSAYVKEQAATALGMLGDNRALDVFSSIMDTKQIFLDKFCYLKERIVEALSKFDISKDKKALTILKSSLLDTNPRVRISAIETLMSSDIEGSYNLIYERLKFDDDIEVQKNALIALYNISDKNILLEVLEGKFNSVLKLYAKEIIDEYENE